MYDYHWVGFISILFLRLHIVFKNSIIAVYRGFNVISISIIVIFAAGSTVNYVTFMSGLHSEVSFAGYVSVLVTVMLLYSQFFAFVFVRRLFKLNALATKDDQLILAMTKYAFILRFSFCDLSTRILSVTLTCTHFDGFRMTSIAFVSILGSVCYIFGLITISTAGVNPVSYIFVDSGGYAV